ncbi:MAG TPA: cupin domain-containing protein [Stellaceae bacterium]|nr:cupin domain-containing protein [Stellaceae bacterium]
MTADRLVAAVLGVVAIAAVALTATLTVAAGPPSRAKPIFSRPLPNVPGKTLTAVTLDYDPGAASKPHHHAGVVFAYVLSGAVRSQVDADGPRVYTAGESFFEGVGAHHLVSENASATEPARLLAIIIADDGATLTTLDP